VAREGKVAGIPAAVDGIDEEQAAENSSSVTRNIHFRAPHLALLLEILELMREGGVTVRHCVLLVVVGLPRHVRHFLEVVRRRRRRRRPLEADGAPRIRFRRGVRIAATTSR